MFLPFLFMSLASSVSHASVPAVQVIARVQNSWLSPNKHFSTTVQSELIEPSLHVDFTCTVPHKPVKVP